MEVNHTDKGVVLRKMAVCLLTGMLFFCFNPVAVYGAAAAKENQVTVVLDPGHGGGNLGGEYGGYTEKDLTVIVAQAMKEELEKYEGITVYMTREEDKDMSLEERVRYAESVQADFFFCLHFNMSLNHNLYGAEVWVSAFGEEYRDGYTFADVEMTRLRELGLYSRGIKTRLNDSGQDYYGIIRHATEIHMPAVIIEHCHLDQENDSEYYTSKERLEEFGRLDATAVAQYYGLRSETSGVDYSNFRNIEVPVPSAPVKPDKTEPDVCMIEVMDVDEETGDIIVELSAQDYDSNMLYYSYSYDGGKTFSELQEWQEGEDTIRFSMHVPSGTIPEIAVNAYNGFDLYTESNHVFLASLSYGEEEAVPAGHMIEPEEDRTVREEYPETAADIQKGEEQQQKKQPSIYYFLEVCLLCVAILFILLLLARIILLTGKSKKKRRGRK